MTWVVCHQTPACSLEPWYLYLWVDGQTCLILTIAELLPSLVFHVTFYMLTKESDNLCSSNLQFSFKPGALTSLCTSMVQETISYYVNNGSNVYVLCWMIAKHLTVLITVSYLKCCCGKQHLSFVGCSSIYMFAKYIGQTGINLLILF